MKMSDLFLAELDREAVGTRVSAGLKRPWCRPFTDLRAD
jgi:hypothetical protein